MLEFFLESGSSKKEKFLLLLTILFFGLILLVIYAVVETVRGFHAVHNDLATSQIKNREVLTAELATNEEHL